MQFPHKLSRTIDCMLMLFLVSACASVKIDSPGPEVQSILILPYYKLDTTGWGPGYIYHYYIVNLGDDSITYEAKFDQSGKEGYLLVDSLPPGNYRVDKVTVNPVGVGTRNYDRSEYRRNEKFKLVAGKITIFQKSIHVFHTKDPLDPGRSWTSFRIVPTFSNRRNNILGKLEKQENFDKWEVLGFQYSVIESSVDELPELDNQPVLAPDITGTYVSDIETSRYDYFSKKDLKLALTLKQQNNSITGTDSSGKAEITGSREGNAITFIFWSPKIAGGCQLDGMWEINSDGTRLDGSWKCNSAGGIEAYGKWNLTKIQ